MQSENDSDQSTSTGSDFRIYSKEKVQRNRVVFTREQLAALEKGL